MKSSPAMGPGALRERFESLPLSTFDVEEAADPSRFLPLLFGPATTVEPVIYCADLGAWLDGWSVLTTLPEAGTFGFVLAEYTQGRPWSERGRGRRIDALSRAVNSHVWSAPDMPGLLHTVVADLVADFCAPDAVVDFDKHGVLNSEHAVWMLRHWLRASSAEEVEVSKFLLSLSLPAEATAMMERLLYTADHVAENWTYTERAEEVATDAVRQREDLDLNAADIESTGIVSTLLGHPAESWPGEAARLLAQMADSGALPDSCYRAEPTATTKNAPPAPDSARKGAVSWAIAV